MATLIKFRHAMQPFISNLRPHVRVLDTNSSIRRNSCPLALSYAKKTACLARNYAAKAKSKFFFKFFFVEICITMLGFSYFFLLEL